jgi:hypothetical protein
MNNTRFPFVVGVTLCADNSADYVITGATTFSMSPNDATYGLIDGQVYTAFVRYPDNTTTGYEEVTGAYTASTDTLARTAIGKSSAGYGTKVNWGSSAPKHIAIVVSGNEMGNLAQVLLDKPPHLDVLQISTGQSNIGTAGVYVDQGAVPAANPNVLDWSFSSTDSTAMAWRAITLADDYTTENADFIAANNSILTGFPRYSSGSYRGNMGYACAKLVQELSGRKVRTINTWRNGTGIEDTHGWAYETQTGSYSTANTGEHFKKQITDAIAALPTDQAGLTPDYMIFMQGETDMANDMTAAKYGFLLADYLRACEDPNRYGITTKDKTLYLVPELNPVTRKINATTGVYRNKHAWNGQKYAKEAFGPRLIVVDSTGTGETAVPDHITGEDHDIMGRRLANALFVPAAGKETSVFEVRKNPVVKTRELDFWYYDGSNNGSPASGKYYHRTNSLSIAVHESSVFVGSFFSTSGLAYLRPGDILFSRQNGTPTKYFQYLITNIPTLSGSIWTIPCVIGTGGGGVDVTTGIGIFTCDTLPADMNVAYVAQIDGDYGSRGHSYTAAPKRTTNLRDVCPTLDDYGIMRRRTDASIPDLIQIAHTSGAVSGATSNIFTLPQPTASSLFAIDFFIGARVADTTANFYYNTFKDCIYYMNASTTVSIVQSPTAGTAYNPSTWLTTAPTFFNDTTAKTLQVRCVGVAAKEIDYTVRARITEILMP